MNHNHPDKRYLLLAEKWLNGTITPAEEAEYGAWFNSIDDDAELKIPAPVANNREQLRSRILKRINKRRKPAVPMYKKALKLAAAAALVSALGGAAFTLFYNPKNPAPVAQIRPLPADIKPGTNGAILKLANGNLIILDTTSNGQLAGSNNASILKQDAILRFDAVNNKNGIIEYNTLTTPRARQQQLILADGSHIWLNAESSITFPSAFTGALREVEITGEAYFEVAKNAAKPFVVKVNEATVKVLGTHFNVMAYRNETILKTTLLEGAVTFSKGNNDVLLKPGQQSQLATNGNIKLILDADIDLAVAWKNGKQVFDGADLKAVLRQIERWYDIDVEYAGNFPTRTFTGDIPRTANLSEILKLLEINKIHTVLKAGEKKLTITP